MSDRNGDKARFQKNRQRKLKKRQRIQAMLARHADLKVTTAVTLPAASTPAPRPAR